MRTAIRYSLALPMAAFLIVASPAVAGKGGNGNAYGQTGGNSHGLAKGHSKGGGGGAKGTPAPIAGLGVLALGAIGYGSRKLRKHPPK